MSSAEGLTAGHPDSPGMRRWRLLARMAETVASSTLDISPSGYRSLADTLTRQISEEIGNGTVLVLLDLPGHPEAVISYVHPDPARMVMAEELFSSTDDAEVLAWAQDLAPLEGRTQRTLADANPTAAYARKLIAYGEKAQISDTAYAAIRHPGGEIRGIITCTRDQGSPAFDEFDLSAIAAAADAIGLGLELITTRASERTAIRRWNTAFDVSPIGHILLSTDGRIQAVNPAGCEIAGRARDELIGKHWRLLADGADYDEDIQDINDMFAGLQGVTSTRQLLRADGTRRWVHRSISMVRDDAGEPDVIHLQFIDVTDQHDAEARAALFVSLIESSPDYVGIASMEGQLQYLNSAGRELVGLPEDVDVSETRMTDYHDEQARPIHRPISEWPVVRDGFFRGDSTIRDWRDGSNIPVSVRSFVMKDIYSGEPIAIATVQRDIRERIASQQAIEELAEQRRNLLIELVSAEQAERQRIANDVHDDSIQLLAAAQLRLQLLAGQLERGEIDAAKRATDGIAELAANAQRQLRRVLLDLEPPHSPERFIDEALRQAADNFFADTDTVVTVTGTFTDVPTDVASVFYRAGREAVSNARRHAQASRVTITLSEDDQCWRMEVVDDGVGVPDTIEVQPGHLGIRGMTSRVEALGGTCLIERVPSGGTRVLLEVPHAGRGHAERDQPH